MRRGRSRLEECGRPLLLGKNERSEIDCCVNPSLQRKKADTSELAATSPSPALASPGERGGRSPVVLNSLLFVPHAFCLYLISLLSQGINALIR